MTIEDNGIYPEDVLEHAYDVLTELAWDGPVELVRPAKTRLLELFGLGADASVTLLESADIRSSNSSRKMDENASYQALIDDGSRL